MKRRQVLLSTATLVGALTGYGRSADAACAVTVSPAVECSGANIVAQTLTLDNATVSTLPGFSVITPNNNGVRINGGGALSFIDTNTSTITSNNTALRLNVTGNPGGVPGSININTNGVLTGGQTGLDARNSNSSTGSVTVVTNGDVTGTGNRGIFARSGNNSADLSITTGAGTTVSGNSRGISAENRGSGDINITANGDVTGTAGNSQGINAQNRASGNDFNLTTGTGTTVSGGDRGIRVTARGTGVTTIILNGDVTGTSNEGINAQNNAGSGLSLTTAAGTTIMGGNRGIRVRNNGTGATTVTANGTVTGTNNEGIYARNTASGGAVRVTTGGSSDVTGGSRGIFARSFSAGALEVIANGDVTGTSGDGIQTQTANSGTTLSVTTGTGTTVTGNRGIRSRHYGTGTINVTANGNVAGTGAEGIYARNQNGTDISVTTGTGTTVTGSTRGIRVRNQGNGALDVTANGDVTGGSQGIYARNRGGGGTDLSVTTSASSTVTGGNRGIYARQQSGSGAVTINAQGNVTGTADEGIYARNQSGTDLSVTTGAGGTVTGGDRGIFARQQGSGALTIKAQGNVTGTASQGIYAENLNGTDLSVTTGGAVTGGVTGIRARNNGSGALSINAKGDATGTTGIGIEALNSAAGSNLSLTTGVGSNATGGLYGIHARNLGSGTMNIVVNGNVTGNNDDGILALHAGAGSIDMTIGSGSTVTSNGAGVGDFAIQSTGAVNNLTVAGRLNGGTGGAIQFDPGAFDDRLELHPTAVVNGNVFAALGNDTLAFAGTGDGNFDLSDIDTGANTQQYQDFEIFEVDSAAWSFTGATTHAFTVNGGVVKGTGTFGDLTVINGILAPGNSIGTMTVNGVFTLGAGAIYEAEVNAAGQNDQVIVNGTVNLTGATLNVLAASGAYKPKTEYVIIDNDGADAVNGVFAAITSSLAFLTPTVFYNGGTGNDVVLRLERNATIFSDVAKTPNQKAVAGALDKFQTNDGLFLAVVNQTAAGARQAFDALSGEIHATLAGVLADDSRYVREAIMGRLMQAGHSNNSLGATGPQVASLDQNAMTLGGGDAVPLPASPAAFWTEAYGAWGDYDGNGNAATADRDLGGFVSGVDANIGGTWRAGFATGASYSSIDVNARNSSADVDSFLLAGYAGGMAGSFALRGGGAWAWNDIDTLRAVIFPGFFERQTASYHAETGQIFGEVAYPTTMGGMSVEPFAGLAYVSVDTNTFDESGGALASLNGSSTDQGVGYSTLGFRAASTMHWGSRLVTPHISAAWQHAFDDVTPGAALAFASNGIGFNVTGVPIAKDSALIDAGLDLALGESLTAGVSYSGQFADGVQDNAVKGRFTLLF